jgi:hypothetical protein
LLKNVIYVLIEKKALHVLKHVPKELFQFLTLQKLKLKISKNSYPNLQVFTNLIRKKVELSTFLQVKLELD